MPEPTDQRANGVTTIHSVREISFCPFCADALKYEGHEDTEIWECPNCKETINYTNPNHT